MRNPADVKAHTMIGLIRNSVKKSGTFLFFVQVTNVKHMDTN